VEGVNGGLVLAHAGPGDVPSVLTSERLLTAWTFAPLPAAAALLMAVAYVAGVRRLRARGVRWSPWRTLSFVGGGLGSLVLATQSALATYDTVLISVHMIQHMVLNMAVPIFLALGAPVTLALRTVGPGIRRALLAVLHSRVAGVLTFPVVAGAIFVANPFVLYMTGLYEATLRNPWLHDLNHLHFVAVGALWFWPLLGLDPLPRRAPYGLRMLAVFVTLPFHAFLGVVLMGASPVLGGGWYAELGRTWGPSPAQDQETAGGILWATGDLVGVLVLGVLFAQWVRASEREAAREDRRLDRSRPRRPRRSSVRGRRPRRGNEHRRRTMPGVPDHPEEATMTTAPRSDAPTALPDDGRTVSVLVYSDNRAIRERVVSGLGRRPAPDVPRVRILECATPPAVIGAFDAGQVDVAVLDGEAAPRAAWASAAR
jgi:putative copper resistance protein D